MGECIMLRRGGSGDLIMYKPPVLDAQYPEDQSVTVVKGQSRMVTFHVAVAQAGVPNTYGYQWYVDGSAVEGETSSVYVKDVSAEGEHRVWCEVSHVSGTVTSRIAALTVKEYYTPVLNSAYPMDTSVIAGKSATFSTEILTEGDPAEYTYQWYVDSAPVAGATSPTYTHTTEAGSYKSYSVYCVVTNAAGSVTSRIAALSATSAIPEFTYTGTYEIVDDDDNAITQSSGNWKIRFLTSGTLTFTDLRGAAEGIDVFCVGGGGNGGDGAGSVTNGTGVGGAGGGGGYTKTKTGVPVEANTLSYDIIVGGATGASSGFGVEAKGGKSGGKGSRGADGGSGGGGPGTAGAKEGAGGTDGGNGGGTAGEGGFNGGYGQGTTTREFAESGATLYSTGGHGGYYCSDNATPGGDNTGNGGKGAQYTSYVDHSGGAGGSGIVIIRNAR